jgi:hypothetical protein
MILFIPSDNHLDGAGQSLRHFLDKFKQWHFHSPSNEVIWLKKKSDYMKGLKSAILAIFQTGPGWPCPVSTTLNIIFALGSYEFLAMLEGKTRKGLFF